MSGEWLPPRHEEPEIPAAFSTDDVHGYVELGRRLKNTAILCACVLAGCGLIYLTWRLTSG